jgi:carboxyl-terminal processing protease
MPFVSKIKDRLYSLRKAPPMIYWGALTAVICFFIVSVSVQKADAQSFSREQAETQYKSIIQTVFDFIQRNYVEEVNPQSLYEGAMNGMFEALGDPYSSFLQEKDMVELDQNVIKGSYGGVGLYISKQIGRASCRERVSS